MDQKSHLLGEQGRQAYNLVVVGDGAVGKTCMLITYAKNEFPKTYVPTVFDNYVVTVGTPDGMVDLSLKDTTGQEDLAAVRKLSYHGADVFVICFAVIYPTSFENLTNWAQDIESYNKEQKKDIPFILVGTQVDLREDRKKLQELATKNKKPITYEEGVLKARELGAYCYVECSALTRHNLPRVFSDAVSAIVTNKKTKASDEACCVLL